MNRLTKGMRADTKSKTASRLAFKKATRVSLLLAFCAFIIILVGNLLLNLVQNDPFSHARILDVLDTSFGIGTGFGFVVFCCCVKYLIRNNTLPHSETESIKFDNEK